MMAVDTMDMDAMDMDTHTSHSDQDNLTLLLEAPAKYAKQPATLSLYRPSSASSAADNLLITIAPANDNPRDADPVAIPFADIANLQQVPNKPTLKFLLLSRPNFSPIVHLTHPTDALAHTQTITEAVASLLALRMSNSNLTRKTLSASAPASASASRSSSRSATPAPSGPSAASSTAATPTSSLVRQLTNLSLRDELELRAELLKKHRTLAKLHQDLVRSGHVTENEFWAARKPLLERAALEKSQKPGHKSTRPPDVGRQTGDNKVTFTVTPQLVHSIFLQYPSVHRLFMQKVPVEMSEKDFWQRYVQSSLFKQSPATVAEIATSGEQIAGSRAGPAMGSAETSSSSGTGQDDAMFDACFSEEVQRLREEMAADIVRPTLNLTATEEDRVDINGNMPDKMMRFTEEASILKKFNQHSSRILHSVIKHKRDNPPTISSLVTSEVQMDDLAPEPEAIPIPLDLDTLSSNQSTTMSAHDHDGPMAIDTNPIDPTTFLATFHSTSLRLGSTILDLSCQRAANDLESSLLSQRTVGTQATSLDALSIPQSMARDLEALNATATELLRHYWGASRMDPEKQKRVRGALQVHVDKVDRWLRERGHVSKVVKGLVDGCLEQMRFALEGHGGHR